MFQNVHDIVGLIELTNSSADSATAVDDSTLDRLLESLVSHDSLADDLQMPELSQTGSDWRRTGDESTYLRRASVNAELAALVSDLEREYAQLCEALNS